MIRIPYQFQPLSGEGAKRYGGRWNRVGQPALYLAREHATAIAEYHQGYVMPGTLAAYDIVSDRIADLTNGAGQAASARIAEAVAAQWQQISASGDTPPSWAVADGLLEQGAYGALVPSAQCQGGTNFVLWKWGRGGARIALVDPAGDLGRH